MDFFSKGKWKQMICLMIIVSIATIKSVNADCLYTASSGSSIDSSGTIYCSADEKADPGILLCIFSVSGEATVTLSDSTSPNQYPITNYVEFYSNQSESDDTVVYVTLTSSIDEITDEVQGYLMGTVTCKQGEEYPTSFILTLTDENDHDPEFIGQTPYYVPDISETFPSGIDILALKGVVVMATDHDQPGSLSSTVKFSLEDDYGGAFVPNTITYDNSSQLQLYVNKTLDYNDHNTYILNVIAQDAGTPPRSSTAQLTVKIIDTDNLDPKFDYTFYSAEVLSLDGSKQELTTNPAPIHAFDQDTGINEALTYGLVFSNENPCTDPVCQAISAAFSINPKSGVITIDTTVDLSAVTTLVATFAVQATQDDDARHTAFAFVSVTLPSSGNPTDTTTTNTPITPTTAGTITTGTTSNPCTTLTEPTSPSTTTISSTFSTAQGSTATPCVCPDTSSPTTIIVTSPCPPCPTDATTITSPTPSTTLITTNPSHVTSSTGSISTSYTCSPSDVTKPATDSSGSTNTLGTGSTKSTVQPPSTTSTQHPATECPTPIPCTTIIFKTDTTIINTGTGTIPTGQTTLTTGSTITTNTPISTLSPEPANDFFIGVRSLSAYTYVGTPIAQFKDVYPGFSYSLTDNAGRPSYYFAIDAKTGEITVTHTLDYKQSPYSLMVYAVSDEDGSVGDTASLFVEVLNEPGPTSDIPTEEPPNDDNTVYIIVISVLAALLFIFLVLTVSIYLWKTCRKSNTSAVYHSSPLPLSNNNPKKTSSALDTGVQLSMNGMEKEFYQNELHSVSSVEENSEINRQANGQPNQALSTALCKPVEYVDEPKLDRDSIDLLINESFSSLDEQSFQDEPDSLSLQRVSTNDDLKNERLEGHIAMYPDLDAVKAPDPDPDYIQETKSILIDPNAIKSDEEDGEQKTKPLGVKFNDTPEVIDVNDSLDNTLL